MLNPLKSVFPTKFLKLSMLFISSINLFKIWGKNALSEKNRSHQPPRNLDLLGKQLLYITKISLALNFLPSKSLLFSAALRNHGWTLPFRVLPVPQNLSRSRPLVDLLVSVRSCGRLSGFGFQGIGSWSDEKWQILKGLRKAGHQSKTHYTVLVTRWCSPYIIILPYYCLRHGKFRKALVPWHCNASYGQTVAQAVHTPFSKPLHFAPGQKHTCFSLRHLFGMSFQKKHSWKCVDCSVQNGIPCWSTENLIKQDSVIRLSLLGCDPSEKEATNNILSCTNYWALLGSGDVPM